MTTPSIELKALPAAIPTFFNAALTARRRPPEKIQLPQTRLRIAALRIDRGRLRAYNELLGFADRDVLPLTYPHVLGSALHMHLMAQPGFPLPMLGLVHLRNEIEQERPIEINEMLALEVRLTASRAIEQGLEFDLLTEFVAEEGKVRWRGVSTYLHRVRPKSGTRKPPPAFADIHLSQYLAVEASADIGRRYAKVSRDYNPIHLYALTARLFGFPRAIATGMWTAAHALALLEPRLRNGPEWAPRQYRFQFKQPFLLPGRAALRFGIEAGKADFALVGADAGKVHLLGTLS